MSDLSASPSGERPAAPVWRGPALVLALLLVAAGAWLQQQPSLNHHLFHVLNESAGGPARPSAGLWSALSVAGLGVSVLMLVAAWDRAQGLALAAALWCVPVAALLTHVPKTLIRSPRPPKLLGVDALQVIGEPILNSPSMPSGHSLTAFAVATLLAGALARRPWQGVGLVLLAAAVAVSRMAVGAHWPSDVLAGAGLGVLSGLIALALAQRTRLRNWLQGTRGRRGVALLELALAVGLLATHTGYPAAWPLQGALAFMSLCSALSRWRHAGQPAGADAAVARLVLPSLAAGLLLSALMQGTDLPAVGRALAVLPAWAWCTAVAGLWGSYLLRAERLRREWAVWGATHRPQAPMPGLLDSLDLFLAHNAALVLLPMRAGEAGYPWLLYRRWQIPVSDSVRSLVWLRLQDATVLGLLGLLLLAPGPAWVRAAGVAALVAGGALLLPRLSRGLGRRWARWQSLTDTLVAHRGDRAGWWLCLGNWLLKLSVLGGVLAWMTGLPLWQGQAGAVAGELAAALPVQAPAGLGSYEAAVWAAGQWVGAAVPPDRLAAAALAVHALGLLTALLSPLIFRVLTWARPRRSGVAGDETLSEP